MGQIKKKNSSQRKIHKLEGPMKAPEALQEKLFPVY